MSGGVQRMSPARQTFPNLDTALDVSKISKDLARILAVSDNQFSL